MNRLKKLFQDKNSKQGILNIYCTAGFPELMDTEDIILNLTEAGADIIELGIPFSDPLADGETIQQSSERAIRNGITLEIIFDQLKNIREKTQIPIIMMGYLNSIMQFGLEKFWAKARQVGIDGFIFPDLPPHEYIEEWKTEMEKNDLCFSFLVTPETPMERVKYLDSLSSGFLYAVSSSSTTGSKQNDQKAMKNYLQKLRDYKLENPVLAGFGIKSNADYRAVNKIVDGAIIGSAFIRHVEKNGATPSTIKQFIQSIKG